MRKKLFFLLILTSIFSTVNGFTEENKRLMTLGECINTALQDNLSLKSYYLGLDAQNQSILQAESKFDPSLSFSATRNESKNSTFYNYYTVSSVRSKSSAVNLSLDKNLLWGTNIGAGFYNTLSESNIETRKNYSSNLGLNLTQPLLRGFGKTVTMSSVYFARINSENNLNEIENQTINLINDVQTAYWNLVFARESLKVKELSLAQADSLLSFNERSYSLGVLTESDVLEAKSARYARKQDILDQEGAIKSREDILKRLLNFTGKDMWEIEIVPTDSPFMEFDETDMDTALKKALENRPDYKNALKNLEQNELQKAVAKNGLLPGLDLNARYVINSSGETYSKDIRDLNDTDEYGWNIGVTLSYPLKNKNAKAEYQIKEINIKRAKIDIEDIKASIMSDIRNSRRNVILNKEKMEVARLALEVNENKLKKEEEKFRNKLSSSYYVLQYQRDLADALNSYNKARLDYAVSVSVFYKASGMLLEKMNIKLTAIEQ